MTRMADNSNPPRRSTPRPAPGIFRRLWGGFWGALSGAFIATLVMIAAYKFVGWPIGTSWLTWLPSGTAIGLVIGIIWPAVGEAITEIVSYILP